jgi:hypothetical protein
MLLFTLNLDAGGGPGPGGSDSDVDQFRDANYRRRLSWGLTVLLLLIGG